VPHGNRTPKFAMPSVYKPKNENIYRCKVGFYMTGTGKRERREFRLGDDYLIAHKKALTLGEKWLQEELRHEKLVIEFKATFPADPLPQLVWTGTPETDAAAHDEYLATPPEELPGDDINTVNVSMPGLSLAQASRDLLDRLRAKAKRDAKSFGTFRWYERELRLGVATPAINPIMGVNGITIAHVEKFCDYWCDLSARAAETKKKSFRWRTAWNRIDAFGFLLRDLKGRLAGFVYPERADAVMEEAKATVAGPLTAIHTYAPVKLKEIFTKGDGRLRLVVYLALNLGAYQSDIGQQLRRRHTFEHGGMVELDDEMYMQWHRHKLKRRQRALMRKNEEERPVLLTHYLWPETLKLLYQFAAPEDTPYNLWLLNQRHQPLWRHEEHHKRPVDAIGTAYNRAKRRAGVRLPFDQIRKFGGTAAEAMSTREVQEMYRGERRQGSSRVYVLQDFTGNLTPFLKAWGERLRADGVLY
jgi:hypothetical protein